jgi:hypothetical protein
VVAGVAAGPGHRLGIDQRLAVTLDANETRTDTGHSVASCGVRAYSNTSIAEVFDRATRYLFAPNTRRITPRRR